MKAEIQTRFASNLARVESLIAAYDTAVAARGGGAGVQGRVAVATTDLLRAAVVFLHATLEDLLRSALDWRLPFAAAHHLASVPLANCERGGSEPWCDLSDLALHRGKSVDAVLAESVSAHLESSNFNNPGHVIRAVTSMGVDPVIVAPFMNLLGPMMARRHWIVHRADRNQVPGKGQYVAQSITPTTVRRWLVAVRDFGNSLTTALP